MLKDDILKELIKNKDTPLSGEFLALKFNVTRAAIWKTIRKLQVEGHNVVGKNNMGYLLMNEKDIISENGIRHYLNQKNKNISITCLEQVDSTNNKAKEMSSVSNSGSLIVANEQTAGRGRQGRAFISPKNKGVFMSFILKPKIKLENAMLITVKTCVCVCRAIEKLTGDIASIKWVNDIFYKNKKICGILTEAVSDFESGMIESIIIGIGININLQKEDIPQELQNIVGTLNNEIFSKNEMIAEIANQILDENFFNDSENFINYYREKSFVLNKTVFFNDGDTLTEGIAKEILDNGNLKIITKDGKERILTAGEISIKNYN